MADRPLDLGAVAEALQVWAFYSGCFDATTARLSMDAPFPSSAYTGLATPDRPGSRVARDMIADLEALAASWEAWERDHPNSPGTQAPG